MYHYNAETGLEKIPLEQVKFLKTFYDKQKHQSLAEAIGFDAVQDIFVLDESIDYDAQDYSIAVKTVSDKTKSYDHGYTNYHAVIEVRSYDSVSLVFVEDPLSLLELLSELLAQQELLGMTEYDYELVEDFYNDIEEDDDDD